MKDVKLVFNGGYQMLVQGDFSPEDLEVLSKSFKGKYRYTVDTLCVDFSLVACMMFVDREELSQKVTESLENVLNE